jgi:tetratricopeptide (TPR) repeat protein
MTVGKKKDGELRPTARSTSVTGYEPRVVPEAAKKPVRSKPMRGPGITSSANGGSAGAFVRPASPTAVGRSSDEMLLQMAAQPTVASPSQAQAKLKEDVCVQMLLGGYVQSYVDMFYLTHRPEPAGDASASGFEIAEIEFLRDQLVTTEHCKRRGDIPDVLNAYESLASYCAEKSDIKTMIFFYEKCLEIARLVKDPMCEMRVLSKIGAGYHTLKDLDKAREYHEQHVAIAQVLYAHEDDAILRGEAFLQLGRVYWDLALLYERKRMHNEAIDMYKKNLDCASQASEIEAVGEAQLKIGICYNLLAQPSNALPFLESFLESCRGLGNVEGEGKACAELATAHENLGNKQLSIEYLNHYAMIATHADNLTNQADACRRLGHIYTASQDFQRAREMHEKNYELTPAVAAHTCDPTALNCSRINVGAARANDRMAIFLTLIKDDFRGLLEWKNSRTLPTAD